MVEVRRGDVVFIPSAFITHSNSSLRAGECRRTVVQYTAGGIWRWVWQGHKPERELVDFMDKKDAGEMRYDLGWDLFPTLKELRECCEGGRRFEGTARAFSKLFIQDDPRYEASELSNQFLLR